MGFNNCKRAIAIALSCVMALTAAFPTGVAAALKTRVSVHDPSIFKDADGTYYVSLR